MATASVTAETLSKAADLRPLELRSRLHGESAFKLAELSKVGGVLRIPASVLVGGISA